MKLLLVVFVLSIACKKPASNKASVVTTAGNKPAGRMTILNFVTPVTSGACKEWNNQLFSEENLTELMRTNVSVINIHAEMQRIVAGPAMVNNTHDQLLSRYNPAKVYPYTVLIDADGKELAHWSLSQQYNPENYLVTVEQLAKSAGNPQ